MDECQIERCDEVGRGTLFSETMTYRYERDRCRTPLFGEEAFAESVARANAYLEAGARCAYVPGAFDRATIGSLAREVSGPLNILASAATPPTSELEALGVARLSVGGGFARAAYTRTREIARELRITGTYSNATDHFSNTELNWHLAGRLR